MKKIILALTAVCLIPLAHANGVSVSNYTGKEFSFEINGVCLSHARVKPYQIKSWSNKAFKQVCGENCEIKVFGEYCEGGPVLATIQSKNYATNVEIKQESSEFGLGVAVGEEQTQFFFSED